MQPIKRMSQNSSSDANAKRYIKGSLKPVLAGQPPQDMAPRIPKISPGYQTHHMVVFGADKN
jgi:hypothetical protein